MYFIGLQNVSHFKYYPKSNFRKKSCKIKLDFKNHRDEQLWNTTGLIRFLVYFTTWQTSYPSPLPQKTSCENEARDKDSSLMQCREKGKARNFFGKPSQPQSSVGLPCFTDSILLPGKAGVQREISALLCSAATWENGGHLLLPIATACSLQQLIFHPTQFSAWRVGLADSASIEKVIDQNELRTPTIITWWHQKARGGEKRFSETRTEREVVNVRLDGIYLSNPSLYTCLSKCYHSNGEDGVSPMV